MHFLPLFLLVLASPVLGREFAGVTKPQLTYTTLDVAASLRETARLVSEPLALEEEQEQAKPWSVRLVHRDTLASGNTPYEQRMKQRLKRDEARVKGIHARVDLAVNGVKRSKLRPSGEEQMEAKVEEFESPIVSGMEQGSGEYFSRIGVGLPPKNQYMVLDTGSDISWIQCQPCADCYEQADPIYNPSLSSTYANVHCESNFCQQLDISACRNDSCLYQVSYGDGSYTVGSFATDTITLGKTAIRNVAIGCGHDNEGLFVGAAGLLGLGGGSLSFPSQLNNEDGKVFSYCLVDRDSSASSTLEFGREAIARGAVMAPLLKNRRVDTFYYVGLTGMSVGGNMVPVSSSVFQIDDSGNGGVIVDSGTAVTRLQTEAYDALRDAFVAGAKDLPATDGVSLFDTCYDLSSRDSVNVPTVGFHFPNGGVVPLPAKNYLVPVDSMGTFCFAFAPTSQSLSIIGNIQQQGVRVSYDTVNNQVGFAVNRC
eukprot:Gb_25577 [translate_table: standard]